MLLNGFIYCLEQGMIIHKLSEKMLRVEGEISDEDSCILSNMQMVSA